ncbi:hypothetical protein NW759_016669, partial [Fusarium solani]
RAARLIGLLVSDAHLLGLHRSSTYEKLPIFWSETACRTWWCIYLLDRRQSLQSGQPYLVQDSNIEARLPLPLDDSWLSRFSTRAEPAVALGNEVSAELAKARLTAIPYLVAMVRIARVIGKVWMLVYGTDSLSSAFSTSVDNHEKIQDDGLKYCFPLSHYVTSTAMVSISLVSREPGLKDSHGILILAATQSLATYCRNVWVSHKMAKCVSNLNSIVLEILGSRSSKLGGRHDLLLHIDEQHGHGRKRHFYQARAPIRLADFQHL